MIADDGEIAIQHRTWDDWAKVDPLWAILSDPNHKGGRWDPAEFFATGQRDVADLLNEITGHQLQWRGGRCLDFGCGVGRLTQALGDHFDECDGVDISETMVGLARDYNKHGDRCRYHTNRADDLSLFADRTFDLVFSTIVLQHNPPDLARRYITEFVRVLKPGGIAVFDMPAASRSVAMAPGSHRARVEIVDPPGTLRPGERRTVRVRATNLSGHEWPDGVTVSVGNHWLWADGAVAVQDDGRAPIPTPVPPGSTFDSALEIVAPGRNGGYVLEADLVEEGVTWFAQIGATTRTYRVAVGRAHTGAAAARSAVERSVRRAGLAARRTLRPLLRTEPGRWLRDRVRTHSESPDLRTTRPAPGATEPAPFTMNALPRQEVEAAVAGAGGRVVGARSSGSGGAAWETYRYFVVRD